MLKKDWLIVTPYMPRHSGPKDEDAFANGKQIAGWLREAGFGKVRTETKMMKPVAVVAVVASVD
jgi:hypothetical protein